jgi:hypothetical protein
MGENNLPTVSSIGFLSRYSANYANNEMPYAQLKQLAIPI